MNQTVRNMFRMRLSLVMAVSMMWVASAPAQTTATAERDPNFVGQGKDGVVTWTVNAAGIPQVHSFRYGDFNYIGFDKAGNSYLRAHLVESRSGRITMDEPRSFGSAAEPDAACSRARWADNGRVRHAVCEGCLCC